MDVTYWEDFPRLVSAPGHVWPLCIFTPCIELEDWRSTNTALHLLHCFSSHCIVLHYHYLRNVLHCIALFCCTLYFISWIFTPCIELEEHQHCALHCIALLCFELHSEENSFFIALLYIMYIVHCTSERTPLYIHSLHRTGEPTLRCSFCIAFALHCITETPFCIALLHSMHSIQYIVVQLISATQHHHNIVHFSVHSCSNVVCIIYGVHCLFDESIWVYTHGSWTVV